MLSDVFLKLKTPSFLVHSALRIMKNNKLKDAKFHFANMLTLASFSHQKHFNFEFQKVLHNVTLRHNEALNKVIILHLLLPLFIPAFFSYSFLLSYSSLPSLLHFLSRPTSFPTSPPRSLTPPVSRLSPCHRVASCLSVAVGVEVRHST